jgi:alanine-glyoxylate transaminase/serine-glyoxylate transaminase/serine-pyruvate transaminase
LWTLNTPRVPAGVDDARVRGYLLEQYGMEIAGGFGPLAGKIFRIGTMGYGSTAENVMLILESLEAALKQQGYEPAGDARGAAEKSLAAVV